MALYRDDAVVLRTWKLGEADRIVSLHTRVSGKVRGVARGVRRTRSKFGSRLEPACHVEIQLYSGRGELDTITQAETICRLSSLRSNPGRFALASAMLEAVEQLSPDREPDSHRHMMLARALETLDRCGNRLVVAGFFLKLLSHEGLRPVLDFCVSCGTESSLSRFHLSEGGVMCRRCSQGRRLTSLCRSLSPEALVLLRMMLGGGLAEALRRPDDEVADEVDLLSAKAMEIHIERRLRSLRVLTAD